MTHIFVNSTGYFYHVILQVLYCYMNQMKINHLRSGLMEVPRYALDSKVSTLNWNNTTLAMLRSKRCNTHVGRISSLFRSIIDMARLKWMLVIE